MTSQRTGAVGAASAPRSIITEDQMPGFTGLTQSPLFVAAVVLTAIVAVGAAALPAPSTTVSFVIVATVLVLAGIPHGAVDHLVAMSTVANPVDRRALGGERLDRRFHVLYLSAIVAVLCLWVIAPVAALGLFLLVSIHHFGQSDLAWCRLCVRRQLPLQWSRGLLLVGLPLVAHLEAIGPTIERLGGGRPDDWAWLADHAAIWSVALIAQHVAVGAAAVRGSGIAATWIGRETVGLTAVVAVLVLADPLVGFAVYFGLWHSLGHLLVLRQALADRFAAGSPSIPWSRFARLALPRTLLSTAGIVAVVAGCHATGRSDDAVAALFVLVSAITVPHLVVVERLWNGSGTGGVAQAWPRAARPSRHPSAPPRSQQRSGT